MHDENSEISLIENPSIPVIVLHIDETQGATIEEMNADEDHNTTCSGPMPDNGTLSPKKCMTCCMNCCIINGTAKKEEKQNEYSL